jgi:DNA-3-methyladenine glycosylase
MAQSRGIDLGSDKDRLKLTSGPGRLCEAFGVTRARDNGCDLTSPASSLWIGEDGYGVRGIVIAPRVGITKATEAPLRYLIEGNPFVSR